MIEAIRKLYGKSVVKLQTFLDAQADLRLTYLDVKTAREKWEASNE